MKKNETRGPGSIGVIMDGSRRFAKKNKLPTKGGHRAGFETLKKMVGWCKEFGVKTIYAYAFSTENWNRAPQEVFDLMELLRFALSDEGIRSFKARVVVIGNRTRFAKDIQEKIEILEKKTAVNKDITVVLALSYGGREEILQAVRSVLGKKIDPKRLTEKVFADNLYTKNLPDPDLIIRTGVEGKETRLSNFLPWQSVYSELFGTKTFWPEFTKREFVSMLKEYNRCTRKKGK